MLIPILALLPLHLSFAPFQAERTLATVAMDPTSAWIGLLDAAKNLRKDFDHRTFDVSSLDENDPETGLPKPRPPEELVVLELREKFDALVDDIKRHGKRRKKLEPGELESFAKRVSDQLFFFSESELIRKLPGTLDDGLRKIRDGLLQVLLAHEQVLREDFSVSRAPIDGIDLRTVYQPPANVAPIICQNYKKDPRTGADDVDLLEACQMGVGAARYMAERYSQNEGKYLGCVDGLQQGLNSGYFMAKDPTPAQMEEARQRYASTKMDSAIRRASAPSSEPTRNPITAMIIPPTALTVTTTAM